MLRGRALLALASSCLVVVEVDAQATACNTAADCAAGQTCQCTQSTGTRRQLHAARPTSRGDTRTMSLKPASGDGPRFAEWKQRMQKIFNTDTLTADQYQAYRNTRHGRRLFGVSSSVGASCGTCTSSPSLSPPPPPLPPPSPISPPSHCTSCCWSGSTAGRQVTIRVDPTSASTTRVWLSTNSDGSNVDLWSALSGGNQQWVISCT